MNEMMRVLIGYDGSPSSNAIFEDLKRAGLPKRLMATIVMSADMPMPTWTDLTTGVQTELVEEIKLSRKQAMERADDTVKGAAESLRLLFPLWNVLTDVREESPVQALINQAENLKADLVVVGAHGHSRLGRFLGSVSQLVLMQAPCSVRISRASLSASQDMKVIVGVDGSSGADKAINAVSERNWPSSTQIHVLSALSQYVSLKITHLVPPEARVVYPVSNAECQVVNQRMETLADQLREKKLDATAYVREGEAKEVILSEAETWKADCIFVGARGLSSAHRFLLGSVSMAIAARAHCSVEVVR